MCRIWTAVCSTDRLCSTIEHISDSSCSHCKQENHGTLRSRGLIQIGKDTRGQNIEVKRPDTNMKGQQRTNVEVKRPDTDRKGQQRTKRIH